MRIALTALTPRGPQDLVVSADDDAVVGQVAVALREAAGGADRLAPVVALPRADPAPGRGRAPAVATAQQAPPAIAAATQRSAASGETPRRAAAQETLWLDGQPTDPRARAASVLRDGALVTTDPRAVAATVLAEPTGLAEVRVAGGPAAGTVHRLGFGTLTIGASADASVRVTGTGLPAYAARLVIGPGGPAGQAIVEPLHGQAGGRPLLLLGGEPLDGPRRWLPGEPLQIGANVLTLASPEQPDAHLSPFGDGGLAYNRPPRLLPARRPRRIEIPAEPKRGEKARLQLLSALLPLVIGAVMVVVLHNALFALFMLMSPVMVIGQWISQRREGRVSYKRGMKEYRRKMAGLDSAIAANRGADETERRDAAPDPGLVLLTATGPRRRLWERRAADPDSLHLRIGLTDLPANIEFVPEKGGSGGDDLPPVPAARSVPLSLPLPSLGVVGVAGPAARSRGLARWLVAQAAVLHSPRDLQVVVLTADQAAGAEWNWVRWLPHCTPGNGEDCLATVGPDPESAARRVAELAAEVGERLKPSSDALVRSLAGGTGEIADPSLGPRILVVLDGARVLRRVPGMPQVLASAKQAGVYAICLDESERVLPEECATAITWEPEHPGWVTLRGAAYDLVGEVLADQVGPAWADRVARALAPVRDVSRDETDSRIPTSARLLDLIGMPDPAPGDVSAVWRRSGRTTAAVLGVGADGPFGIDLRTDGPHGLIAGTTGAGKSELLQTLIASLAVANRPDSMTFVLIDYKGGSAFKDCARLPHTVGMVSDLDGHLTERALASLSAELKRREEILLHAGAKDIEDYWDTRKLNPRLPPLPRLVLVIDEFASLVAELPDFVTGLVGIAQRGRSLGVHLILATQRPAGVVSADIRANTNLRIALRVTDGEESSDVIDVRDAASIAKSTPGRCYVRSGAGTPVGVQSARIGGRRPGAGPVGAPAYAIPVPWGGLGRPLPPVGPPSAEDDGTMATDLSVLVDAIAGAAAELGVPEQPSPWLPPLPEVVTLDELEAVAAAAPGEIPPVPWGLRDVPDRQAREPLTLDLAHGGHLVIAGAARSGRSTALRTIAGSVAAHASPADVHIYALDCGTGALQPVAGLPHCGAVVGRDQVDRIERLIGKLRAEIMRRQQLLAAGGFAGVAEQRASTAAADRLPWMVLLMDWWEGYFAAFENYDYGRLIDALLQVFREGAAVGLRTVVTTDRLALLGQAGTVFGQRMVLRLTDRGDAALAGINERSLPAYQPPGRIMSEGSPGPRESQVAMLVPDLSGPAQVAALRRLGDRSLQAHGRPPHRRRPLRVDPLPVRITYDETRKLDPDFVPPSPMWALVGAGGDELSPIGLDVRDEGPGLVLAGPPRSGRSTTLMTMTRSLLAAGTPVAVITPRRSPLRSLEGQPGVLAVLGADPAALEEAIDGQQHYVVAVDDAELLFNGPLEDPLEKILVSGRDGDHGLIMAGATSDFGRAYSGFIPQALKSRCGVLVGLEGPTDGDLFGVRLPRNAGAGPLGRALLVRAGSTTPVQLAVCE